MPNADTTQHVDPQIKAEATDILSHYGITLVEAYNMFLHKVVMEQGIPFDLRPSHTEFTDFNDETLSAIEEARAIQCGEIEAKSYGSAKEMIDDILGSEE